MTFMLCVRFIVNMWKDDFRKSEICSKLTFMSHLYILHNMLNKIVRFY